MLGHTLYRRTASRGISAVDGKKHFNKSFHRCGVGVPILRKYALYARADKRIVLKAAAFGTCHLEQSFGKLIHTAVGGFILNDRLAAFAGGHGVFSAVDASVCFGNARKGVFK